MGRVIGLGGLEDGEMKKTITKSEYLQLVGLFTLTEICMKQLDRYEKAIMAVVGAEIEDVGAKWGNSDYISDTIYSREDADQLLEKLGIPRPAPEPQGGAE